MNNINWHGIRAFVAVAEYGSFTAAAQETGVSKASLSQHVSTLESQLGVQLLYRTTRKLRLSETGLHFFEQCKRAIQQLEQSQEWVSQSTQSLSGRIRMNSVGGLIGEQILAPLLIAFQQQYPQIEISLDFSSPKVDLLTSGYDLVLRMGSLPDSSLIARKLDQIQTLYTASPAFLEKHGEIRSPEDLVHVPLIYGSVSEWQLKRDQQLVRVQASRGFQIANGRVMLQATLAGLGVSRLADAYVSAALSNGSLLQVLPEWHETTPLSLLCPPLRHQLLRVRTLMDWLIEQFPLHYQEAKAQAW